MFTVIDCLGNETQIPKGNPHLWKMKPTDEKVVAEDGTEYVNENIDADACNTLIVKEREKEYREKTDALFFAYEAGEATKQEWLDARSAIKTKIPKKEK